MTVTWHPNAAEKVLREAVSRGVRKAGFIVEREAKRKIVEDPKTGRIYGNHQASAPGEAPASDTGRLLQSGNTSFDPTEIKATVSFSAAHAAHMEFGTETIAPRPFLRPALDDKKDEIIKAISDEVGKVKAR